MGKTKKRRIGYRVRPPYMDLGKAIEVIRRIYEEAGGSVTEDQLSGIMGNSPSSSSFVYKVQALKTFQLIQQEGPGQHITLSDIGRRVIAPTDPRERAQALREAFLGPETHRTLYDAYAGKLLPSGEFFLNAIRERCGVPQELATGWKDSFMGSGAVAGLLQERSDGKMQLRSESNSVTERGQEETVEPLIERPQDASRGSDGQKRGEKFSVPLLDGRMALVELPSGWTPQDVKKMLEVMRVMFLWTESQE